MRVPPLLFCRLSRRKERAPADDVAGVAIRIGIPAVLKRQIATPVLRHWLAMTCSGTFCAWSPPAVVGGLIPCVEKSQNREVLSSRAQPRDL